MLDALRFGLGHLAFQKIVSVLIWLVLFDQELIFFKKRQFLKNHECSKCAKFRKVTILSFGYMLKKTEQIKTDLDFLLITNRRLF